MAHPLPNTAADISGKPRPALKLVKTQDLSRDQWLQVRKGGIGSSDAAAAVGLHPYKSQLQLWMEKTGQDGALLVPDPNDDTSPMYWGTVLEPIVATHYEPPRVLRRLFSLRGLSHEEDKQVLTRDA